jgi:hypothetical protein
MNYHFVPQTPLQSVKGSFRHSKALTQTIYLLLCPHELQFIVTLPHELQRIVTLIV